MGDPALQDRRYEAIGAAAATVMRHTEYHRIRTQDVAAHVRLDESGDRRSAVGGRSAVWLYNEARSRRVLVALGAKYAWEEYLAQNVPEPVAPVPADTVSEAVHSLSAALLRIARFHRVESFLTAQFQLGIGDIATSEKRTAAPEPAPPPAWPDTPWGRVAAEGFAGRCAVFADYLAPVIARASACVVPLAAAQAAEQAASLSDLLLRGLAGDREGPLERLADGFAAFWFERDLVRTAGHWVRDLHTAERALAAARRQTTDPRAAAAARGTLIRVLLASGVLYARCAAEGAARTEALYQIVGRTPGRLDSPDGGPGEPADLRALCDSTNRQGLAAHRFGDLEQAVESYRASLAVAEQQIADTDPRAAASYMARAEHNLAQAALDRGLAQEAAARCEAVYQARKLQLEAAPGSAPAWRRLSLTAELRARAAAAAGHPASAVRLAERLLADREAQVGRPDHPSVTDARSTLGQALLEAGHPLEARHHLETAHRHRLGRTGARHLLHRDQLSLARIGLELDHPADVAGLLPTEETLDWYEERVSFRLAAAARSLRALALARLGSPDAALVEAQFAVDRLRSRLTVSDLDGDSDLLDLDRARAEILLLAGRADEAEPVLAGIRQAEREQTGPAAARTLLWLARCADARRDGDQAARYAALLAGMPEADLDLVHPVRLAADLDQARRLPAGGAIDPAGRLVAGVLERRLLVHRRPALENGHPLLEAARLLAEQIGLPLAEAAEAGWDE